MNSKAFLTVLLLIPLQCGGSGGSSNENRAPGEGGASSSTAGGAGEQAGTGSRQVGGGGGAFGGAAGSGMAGAPAGGRGGTAGTGGAAGTGGTAGTGASTGRGGAAGTGALAGAGTGNTDRGGDNTGGKAAGASGGSTSTSSGGGGGMSPGFVAFWDFDSMSDGKVPEASGRELPLTVDKGQLAESPSGKSLALPGGQASATAASPILDTSAALSISVWVKLDQLDTWDTFVSQDGQTISSFYLQKRDSNYFAFTTFPSDSTSAKACVAQSTLKPRAGEWYHLVATRDPAGGEQRLYVDGVLVGKTTCAGVFKATGPLVVGRGRWDGLVDWMTGAVDDLGVADRVLKADEIVDLYHQGRPQAHHYLFAYFAEQALGRGDGLRLAHSHDALYWGAIGGGKVFMPPTVGGKSFRDPHVMRDPTGTFHLVWTTSCVPWAESGCVQDRGFGHATSPDLATFSEETFIPVALNVEHAWAPETIWDPASEQFMVYWSSPIDNSPSASDPHSVYYMLTRDFITFTDPKVLFGKTGRDFIDATIIKQGDAYLMFLKDEASGQKNLRALSSTSLFGASAWTADPSAPLTGNYGAEGPSPLLVDGQMILFFDKYNDGAYGALRSSALTALSTPASWSDISSSVFFAGVRHGTAIEVPFDVFRAVARKAAE